MICNLLIYFSFVLICIWWSSNFDFFHLDLFWDSLVPICFFSSSFCLLTTDAYLSSLCIFESRLFLDYILSKLLHRGFSNACTVLSVTSKYILFKLFNSKHFLLRFDLFSRLRSSNSFKMSWAFRDVGIYHHINIYFLNKIYKL